MVYILHIFSSVMSQSIPTGYIPPGQPPGISLKNLPRGSGFDFQKLPGGREFDKGRDFVKNEGQTSNNCVDQIFTDENKKKTSRIFDDFQGYMFS